MLEELRKVIPSFLRRVDVPERGGRWSDYLATTRAQTASLVDELFAAEPVAGGRRGHARRLRPRRRGQAAGGDLLSALAAVRDAAARPGAQARRRRALALIAAYVGDRENRRHKPGRAFERVDYRFDVLSDYGAFRDLQRHRMLTIEWQPLTPDHGYVRPELIDEAGAAGRFDEAMERLGGAVRRHRRGVPRAGVLRRGDGLPGALRDAVQRPRGDPPASSCARAPRATRRTGGSPSRCTA